MGVKFSKEMTLCKDQIVPIDKHNSKNELTPIQVRSTQFLINSINANQNIINRNLWNISIILKLFTYKKYCVMATNNLNIH